MENRAKLTFILLLFLSVPSLAQFTAITGSPVSAEELESYGVAWVDYDNDGDDDLFVTISTNMAKPRKNVLYNNNGDGTFTKILTGDLVNDEGTTRNSRWADYNNDGLIDVFVTDQLETTLYKNTGAGVLTKQLSVLTTDISFNGDHSGAAWGDYNGDGNVDLFLSSNQLNDEARNILYMNNNDGSFTKLSADDIVSTRGSSSDPSWIDYDNDGMLDLFIPNYCSENYLYANQGNGSFIRVINNDLLLYNCSVGSSWADYDNDGDFDVLIQNNANQNNQFFENNGDGSFTQKINELTSHTSTSAAWGDFDNDGYIDLVQVGSYPERETYLYMNKGDKSFVDVSNEYGISNANYSWGVAWADYDKDGFLDFFVANAHSDPLSPLDILYHNTPNENGWINIKLKGVNFNSSAIGAVVKINTDEKWQTRTVQSMTGNNSQNSLNVHFGLGAAEKVNSVIISWPGNGHQEILNQAKNKFIEITELNFPEAPSMLEVDNEDLHQVKLTWTDNADNETGFRIERSIGNANNFNVLKTVSVDINTYNDIDLLEGTTYYYRVASTIEGGFSVYSNVQHVEIKSVTGVRKENDTILAYPNPVESQLTIPYQYFGNGLFNVLNSKGQIVYSGDLNDNDGVIQLNGFIPGIYVIQVGERRFRVMKK
ncbi:MAG: FG-GAP-like repeat-containing protein [Cyclobacteriaceae bacterium]